MKAYYDLHIHSCLSPCADDDMTPQNIVNMAYIKGLDIIAVTDHNASKNVAVVCELAKTLGIVCVPGMEVQTREEVHMLCYFPEVEALEAFEQALDAYRTRIPNNTDKFGHQYVMDTKDQLIYEYPYALILSLNISLEALQDLVITHRGVMVPAHVNRPSNSVLSNLGFIPDSLIGKTIEVYNKLPVDQKRIDGFRVIYNSDAHYLEHIHEPVHFMNLKTISIQETLNYLRGKDRL